MSAARAVGRRDLERVDEPLKTKSARKGRTLFRPWRLALTGCGSGLELATLPPLIGRIKASDRLSARAA